MNQGSDIRGIEAIVSDVSSKISMVKKLVNESMVVLDFESEKMRYERVNKKLKESIEILNSIEDRSF